MRYACVSTSLAWHQKKTGVFLGKNLSVDLSVEQQNSSGYDWLRSEECIAITNDFAGRMGAAEITSLLLR